MSRIYANSHDPKSTLPGMYTGLPIDLTMDEWGHRKSAAPEDSTTPSLLSLTASHVDPQKREVVQKGSTKSYTKRMRRARGVMRTVLPLMRKPSNNQQPEAPRQPEAPPVVKTTLPRAEHFVNTQKKNNSNLFHGIKVAAPNPWERLRRMSISTSKMLLPGKLEFEKSQKLLDQAEINGVRTERLLTIDQDTGEIKLQESKKDIFDGDKQFYTKENLAKRRNLKRSQKIKDAVRKIWDDVKILRNDQGLLEQSGYVLLFTTVTRVFVPDMKDKNLRKSVKKDWEEDSKGLPSIDFERFHDCIFQIVDTWVDSLEESEYLESLKFLAGVIWTYCKMHLTQKTQMRGRAWLMKARISLPKRAAARAKAKADALAAKQRAARLRDKAMAEALARRRKMDDLRAARGEARRGNSLKPVIRHTLQSFDGLPSGKLGCSIYTTNDDHFFGAKGDRPPTPRIDPRTYIDEHPHLREAVQACKEGHGVPRGQALLKICKELESTFGGVGIFEIADLIAHCAFDWGKVLSHLTAFCGGKRYPRGCYILDMQAENVAKKARSLWNVLSIQEKSQISKKDLQALVRSTGGDLGKAFDLLQCRGGIPMVVGHHLRGWIKRPVKAKPTAPAIAIDNVVHIVLPRHQGTLDTTMPTSAVTEELDDDVNGTPKSNDDISELLVRASISAPTASNTQTQIASPSVGNSLSPLQTEVGKGVPQSDTTAQSDAGMTESPLTVASAEDLSLKPSNEDEILAAPRSAHSDENMSPAHTDAQDDAVLSTAPLPEPSEDTSRTDTVADVIYASNLPTITEWPNEEISSPTSNKGYRAKLADQKFSLSRVTHSDEGLEDARTNEDEPDHVPEEISSLPRTDDSSDDFDYVEGNKGDPETTSTSTLATQDEFYNENSGELHDTPRAAGLYTDPAQTNGEGSFSAGVTCTEKDMGNTPVNNVSDPNTYISMHIPRGKKKKIKMFAADGKHHAAAVTSQRNKNVHADGNVAMPNAAELGLQLDALHSTLQISPIRQRPKEMSRQNPDIKLSPTANFVLMSKEDMTIRIAGLRQDLEQTHPNQIQRHRLHRQMVSPIRRRGRPNKGQVIHLRAAPRVREHMRYEQLKYPLAHKMDCLRGTHRGELLKDSYPAGYELNGVRGGDKSPDRDRCYI